MNPTIDLPLPDNIDILIVTESNILLLNESSIVQLANRIMNEKKIATFQTVSISGWEPSAEWHIGQGTDNLLPQLFMVDWNFCKRTKFLFEYFNTIPHCMEASLGDNFHTALKIDGCTIDDVIWGPKRQQWGIHDHCEWVQFAHLDKKPGATDSSPKWLWGSRKEQLDYERKMLQYYGIHCLEAPCK